MECPLFGTVKSFDKNVLPTKSDVCLQYLIIKEQIKEETKSKIDPKPYEVNKRICDVLIPIWKRTQIQTRALTSIMVFLNRLREKYVKVCVLIMIFDLNLNLNFSGCEILQKP